MPGRVDCLNKDHEHRSGSVNRAPALMGRVSEEQCTTERFQDGSSNTAARDDPPSRVIKRYRCTPVNTTRSRAPVHTACVHGSVNWRPHEQGPWTRVVCADHYTFRTMSNAITDRSLTERSPPLLPLLLLVLLRQMTCIYTCNHKTAAS